jgi:predicted Zn-dependent protease
VLRIGKTGYRFIFASRSPNDTFGRDFRQTIDSFKQLTPTERARLRSLRIKVIKTKAGDTPRKLAIGMSGVEPSRRLEFFSILNDLSPNKTIPPGTAIKLVVD